MKNQIVYAIEGTLKQRLQVVVELEDIAGITPAYIQHDAVKLMYQRESALNVMKNRETELQYIQKYSM